MRWSQGKRPKRSARASLSVHASNVPVVGFRHGAWRLRLVFEREPNGPSLLGSRRGQRRYPRAVELPYPDPTVYAIPFFVLTLVLEIGILARWKRTDRSVVGYALGDTLASLAMGLGS